MDTSPKKLPIKSCALWGSAGLADTFLTFGVTTLVMPIYNIGYGIDAVLLGWALAIPRIFDAITDPLIGLFSDNARTRFGRRRPFVFAGAILCAILFPFIWMPPSVGENAMLVYFTILMSCNAFFYTIFNVPYTALGYDMTKDYDDRTRLFAWRFYFGMGAGVSVHWLYKLCREFGETEIEGVKVVSAMIAAVVLCTGILPAIFCKEQLIDDSQPKASIGKAVKSCFKNRAFVVLMLTYLVVVTSMFSSAALALYINIYHVFEGNKDDAATLSGIAGTTTTVAAFIGMIIVKSISEKTGKKTTMIIALSTALVGTLGCWFTLTPKMPYLQLITAVILGFGVQGCWLLVSSLLGDVCDDDELRTGLRQEGFYSAASGFINKCAFACTAILSGYVLKFSGYVEGEEISAQVGENMKTIFIVIQSVGLLGGVGLMFLFPINRKKALETRLLLDERAASQSQSQEG
jgi:GPH family glycoside/pentoside/hexuronide:cation symporter